MERTCITQESDQKCIKIYLESFKERGHLGGLTVEGRLILKWIEKKCKFWIVFIKVVTLSNYRFFEK
jgi:hypothetical protein